MLIWSYTVFMGMKAKYVKYAEYLWAVWSGGVYTGILVTDSSAVEEADIEPHCLILAQTDICGWPGVYENKSILAVCLVNVNLINKTRATSETLLRTACCCFTFPIKFMIRNILI